jgi:hypothetical protein
MPVCRPLSKQLFEVRSTISRNRIARVLFSIVGNRCATVSMPDSATSFDNELP